MHFLAFDVMHALGLDLVFIRRKAAFEKLGPEK